MQLDSDICVAFLFTCQLWRPFLLYCDVNRFTILVGDCDHKVSVFICIDRRCINKGILMFIFFKTGLNNVPQEICISLLHRYLLQPVITIIQRNICNLFLYRSTGRSRFHH